MNSQDHRNLEKASVLHIFGSEFGHDTARDRHVRQNGRHGESQPPISRKRQDVTCKKCSERGDSDRDLLGYASMD
jgi:hypothetical protein